MTELPEEVARELDELFGLSNVPDDAVTIEILVRERGLTDSTWRGRMKILVEAGTWARGKRARGTSYWYWKITDEQG